MHILRFKNYREIYWNVSSGLCLSGGIVRDIYIQYAFLDLLDPEREKGERWCIIEQSPSHC